jgi:hypothetical protein
MPGDGIGSNSTLDIAGSITERYKEMIGA